MSRSIGIMIIILILAAKGYSQLASPERAAAASIKKKRWEKAMVQLRKAVQKDSLNAAVNYLFARFYFAPDNPLFHIDSAYYYINASVYDFGLATPRERERLKRYPMDSTTLLQLRERIDSAAFERAKSINNEQAYLQFISGFPFSAQRAQAMMLRDDAAYQDAVKENTYESFLKFLEKYPAATRAPEARNRYERLLYESKTRDRKLATYKKFLEEYPASLYRREVEQHIFEITTASGETENFMAYLQQYPVSPAAKKARNILYHLLAEQEEPAWPENFLTDSLRKISRLNDNYLLPFMEGRKFGFMDKTGSVVIEPVSSTMADEYLCGNIREDVLVFPDKIVSRDGSIIYTDTLQEVDDIGYGFLKLTVNTCVKVVHKSGFSIHDCIDDARIVAGKFLALRKNDHWALLTLAGRGLTVYEWDDITALKDIVIFKKNKKFMLAHSQVVSQLADQKALDNIFSADEVKPWSRDLLWIRIGDQEGLLNQQLEPVISPARQNLEAVSFGTVSKSSEGQTIYFWDGKKTSDFQQLIVNNPWVAVKVSERWRLFDVHGDSYLSNDFDSLRFAGPFVIGSRGDSVTIYFDPDLQIKVRRPVVTTFLPGKDSTVFLMLEQQGKKVVYDRLGKKLFTVAYDAIQYAGQGLFIVSKKEKKGLLQSDGKLMLPVEFDAIGSVGNNVVSMLKSMKFGVYNVKTNKLIKPQYEKNLSVYNATAITAYQKGLYGFIDWDNKPLSQFEFDEVQYWNDSIALARKKQHWILYNIRSKAVVEDMLHDFRFITDNDEEKLAVCQQHSRYGVISNRRGFVIPPSFSYIVNLGSSEDPLYFTEKHVEEADFFVVIYYDKNMKMLRRQVFDEEEYEKIYCSDK